jgi:hypothetical protein
MLPRRAIGPCDDVFFRLVMGAGIVLVILLHTAFSGRRRPFLLISLHVDQPNYLGRCPPPGRPSSSSRRFLVSACVLYVCTLQVLAKEAQQSLVASLILGLDPVVAEV